MIATDNILGSVLYQQAGRDKVLLPTLSTSVSVSVATVTGNSSQGQTVFGLSQCHQTTCPGPILFPSRKSSLDQLPKFMSPIPES